MAYAEKDFQSALNRWLKENWVLGSAAFELKLAKGKSLPFPAVKEHQINGLWAAKHTSVVHKLSDFTPQQKPFDSLVLKDALAFVGVMFYKPRTPKTGYLIDVDTFETLMLTSGRKSLTEPMARSHAYLIVDLTGV